MWTTGNTDVDDTIIANLPLDDLQHFCATNKLIHQHCQSNKRLQLKITNVKNKLKDLLFTDFLQLWTVNKTFNYFDSLMDKYQIDYFHKHFDLGDTHIHYIVLKPNYYDESNYVIEYNYKYSVSIAYATRTQLTQFLYALLFDNIVNKWYKK